MPFVDPSASAKVRELREGRALSPEALAAEIQAMADRLGSEWTRGTVDAYTIRRIEGKPEIGRQGLVPSLRVQFVIARYFEMNHLDIWKPGARFKAQSREGVAV